MASWKQVEAEEPEFAARVRALFDAGKHKTLATLRNDGSPRISGIETRFQGGDLQVGVMPDSGKLADIRRDPRLALHGPSVDPPDDNPSAWIGEAKIAGRAVAAEDDGGTGGSTFRVDIAEVVLTSIGDPADHLLIESWHPERGLVRRKR